jgi:CheY-like chemotaxis protein
MSGVDVLNRVKDTPELRDIPVVVLSSSESPEDIEQCYEEHANAYLTKPIDADEFVDIARTVRNFWIEVAELPNSGS